jgi:hypothetical protein
LPSTGASPQSIVLGLSYDRLVAPEAAVALSLQLRP